MEVAQDVAVTCKNCETVFDGRFCPNCSQKADTHRFTIKHFLHELFHAITHTDRGILFLVKEMFLRPGLAMREYVMGKRKKYFSPITYFLIITAIQVMVSSKVEIFPAFNESIEQLIKDAAAAAGETVPPDVSMQENSKAVAFVSDNSRVVNAIFIPLLALLSWLFFYKSRMNFAESLVLNIGVSAQGSLYFFPFGLLPFMLAPSLVILWIMLYSFLMWTYTMFAYKGFFQQSWGRTLLKGSVLYLIYTISIQYVVKGLMWLLT